MERLPIHEEPVPAKEQDEKEEKKLKFKDNVGYYIAFFFVIAAVYIITQKVQVPYDQMTITDYTPTKDGESFYVVGELAGDGRFAGSKVELDEEIGVAKIIVYKYNLSSIFGSKEFVVAIDAPEDEVNEIWISCTDEETQKTEETQLDFNMEEKSDDERTSE